MESSTNANSVNNPKNPSSPYYLHLGENPGMILINIQLNGANYHTWSRAMKRALLSKNKLKFIDESLNMPKQGTSFYEAWERCIVMVISWITRAIDEQIAQSTIYIENVVELWEDLKERFSKGDHFRIFDLLQEVHSMKQGERSVSGFFTNLKILWEELESLRPFHNPFVR
ncbi:uncharacterized protein [Phaseolus vulgaris]|uniref:uncharacterized protein n=1 Tax=Phaseolus vulgaris TaxID=3885 RepID=UPI0035CABCF1